MRLVGVGACGQRLLGLRGHDRHARCGRLRACLCIRAGRRLRRAADPRPQVAHARPNEALLQGRSVERERRRLAGALDGRRDHARRAARRRSCPRRALAEALAEEWAGKARRSTRRASCCATWPISRSTGRARPDRDRGQAAALRRDRYAVLPRRSRRAALSPPAASCGSRCSPPPRRATACASSGSAAWSTARNRRKRSPRMREAMAALDPFALAALETLASLAASLTIGLPRSNRAPMPKPCSPPPTARKTGRPNCGAGTRRPRNARAAPGSVPPRSQVRSSGTRQLSRPAKVPAAAV